MASLPELLPILAMMLAAGVFAGLLAGLLGVGGGIVIVPVLESALALMDVEAALRMHIAVATSLAIIVPTSISSSRAHYRRGAVDMERVRRWSPLILLGAVLGTALASQLQGQVLSLLFGVVAILVAIKLALPLDHLRLSSARAEGVAGVVAPVGIGGLSCMIGIGGGTFSVPALTLLGSPMHRAVGTSALFGLMISLPGAITYIVTGWGLPGLPPGNLGYVSLYGLLCIAPLTILAAPWGARLAHRLSQRSLSVMFALFLLVVGSRMLLRGLA